MWASRRLCNTKHNAILNKLKAQPYIYRFLIVAMPCICIACTAVSLCVTALRQLLFAQIDAIASNRIKMLFFCAFDENYRGKEIATGEGNENEKQKKNI